MNKSPCSSLSLSTRWNRLVNLDPPGDQSDGFVEPTLMQRLRDVVG